MPNGVSCEIGTGDLGPDADGGDEKDLWRWFVICTAATVNCVRDYPGVRRDDV